MNRVKSGSKLMAQWHLASLKEALGKAGWHVTEELPGNDYDISGSWRIQRGNEKGSVHIDFDGLDDMEALPMTRAYACRLREKSGLSLYFGKQRSWEAGLAAFISALDRDNGNE